MKQIQLFEHSDHDAVVRIYSSHKGGGGPIFILPIDPLLPSLPFLKLEHFGEHNKYEQMRSF